ncbi:23S rRNA (guanine(2445)-N(2))/(guanine(2069)-N(7))-methyltransferase [Moraxella osloensis]|uniref:Ribosomal RNA large subunit methyltransferase K/L n=1 Tax=Faucicola osloensis TaxID=34062 RepID=A0AA91J948_FAUOS|nr:bifunctional 23S rRNA (guanine(2069)-N(7))-methyltransferase RlmK/23S rRNA (guanine(2445)-N(2))-methyltransferase RlmL [Moraxella osloensis]OBX62445.1 23S rRNA (guanine(2445)-N(2))/(guanine(2069)-N(7))-methyltransferase [Moraxella osloensis]
MTDSNTTPVGQTFHIVITCADGLEIPLQTELASFGIDTQIERTGRLMATLTLAQIYQVCLWSRVASRVLLPLGKKNINPEYDIADQLYTFAKTVKWTQLFDLEQTFAIRLTLDKRIQANQQFTMLRVKDAIADQFNEQFGRRPNVDKNPDFGIVATVSDKQAELYLDLSGTSLHRRGYRVAMTEAPLKENLAAALLYSVNFHTTQFDSIVDPMCGSGTLIIEALLMSADYAIGLDKADSQFGFYAWQHHDTALWEAMVQDAQTRFHHRLDAMANGEMPAVFAFDMDSGAVRATHKNLIAAGLTPIINRITLQQRSLATLNLALEKQVNGWVNPLFITNPPYGERLGEEELIKPLYQGLGKKLQALFADSPAKVTLGVLAAKVEQADVLPLAEPKTLRCHNGAITVYFRYGELLKSKDTPLITRFEKREITVEEGQDFINRLQKNLANLRKLAHKQTVTNLRVYDADLPDFKVAVDVYGEFVHVQEYAAPKSIPLETAKKRFNLALHGVREALQVNREQVFIKTRARQSGNEQYEKKANSGKFHVVSEPTANNQRAYFLVNFSDYLDTGLFLDHRSIRKIIAENSRGKTVLNLFAYTCTASVHAALGGAKAVTSVDLSQNYLDWGRKNFALNGLPDLPSYQFIAQDIFEWIKSNTEQYDVIFIDPPTFSNSKKFQGTFDVQRDHVPLINRAMNRLSAEGVLYFSNNFTKFVLDDEINNRYHVEEMTNQTIGFDFDSKRPIHQSWVIRHK